MLHALRAVNTYMPTRSRLLGLAAASLAASLAAALAFAWRRRLREARRLRAKDHMRLGNALARGGKLERALVHYGSAAELNPQSANAHHNAASICQRLHRFDEAVRHYEAALLIKPAHLESASNLAVALLNDKRPAEAVGACRRALEIEAASGGFNSEAFHHLNVALRLCGRRAAAVDETWRQLGMLDPAFRRPAAVVVDGPAAGSATAAPAPLTVVCVKWGKLYGAEYVNKLARGVLRHLGERLVTRFVCFTDDPTGLIAQVEARPLPERPEWQGWWFKACLFSAEAALRGRILYLDLDTVLSGSLVPLAAYNGGFALLAAADFNAEEGNTDGYNSSVMLWDAGGGSDAPLRQLHDAIAPEVFRCLMRWDHWVEMVVPRATLLQRELPGLCVDYKSACAESGPPAGAAVVCFPRAPKPHEVEADWVREHWC